MEPRQTISIVVPQNWWVGKSYVAIRKRVLTQTTWRVAVVLGEEAWWTFGNRGPNTVLLIVEQGAPPAAHTILALDVATKPGEAVVGLEAKAKAMAGKSDPDRPRLTVLNQVDQGALLRGPQSRISVASVAGSVLLSHFVRSGEGSSTGDNNRFLRSFWEIPGPNGWLCYCQPGFADSSYCDTSLIVFWEDGKGELAVSPQARIQNTDLWRKKGVLIGRVRGITATLFPGGCFSKGGVLVCARDEADLPAIYSFLRSTEYENLVRTIDPRVSVSTSILTDVPFDATYWRSVAVDTHRTGIPEPSSCDPTQRLFDGNPKGSGKALQVAVARMVGYAWPRQINSSFMACPELVPDGLEKHADGNGIVCLNPVKGEMPAADRLRGLLAEAFGKEWSAAKQAELLSQVGYGGEKLEDWLRDGFFEQHCELFQPRPFIWHIWDGLRNGFHALVNYHKLAAPKGEGQRTFEKLIYAYLGYWIKQQRDGQKRGIEGADARVAAAECLKSELEKVLEGEHPYDIFVRWKPLHEQPIGWEPDLNDGVRINIRPFMTATTLNGRGKSACILRVAPKINWDKDRGKEPTRTKHEFPWFWGWDESDKPDFAGGEEFDGNRWNDLHYTREFKRKAREKAKG